MSKPFTRHLCIETRAHREVISAGKPAIEAIVMTLLREEDERTTAQVCVTLTCRSDGTLTYALTVPEQSSGEAAIEAGKQANRLQGMLEAGFDRSLAGGRYQECVAYRLMADRVGPEFGGPAGRVRIDYLFANAEDGSPIFNRVVATLKADHHAIREHQSKLFASLSAAA